MALHSHSSGSFSLSEGFSLGAVAASFIGSALFALVVLAGQHQFGSTDRLGDATEGMGASGGGTTSDGESDDGHDVEGSDDFESVPAGTHIGTLNLRRYCFETFGVDVEMAKKQIEPNAAYNNWRCKGVGDYLDLDDACRHHYGSNVIAETENVNDAFKWVCVASSEPA